MKIKCGYILECRRCGMVVITQALALCLIYAQHCAYSIVQNSGRGKLWQIAMNYPCLLRLKHITLNLKPQSVILPSCMG